MITLTLQSNSDHHLDLLGQKSSNQLINLDLLNVTPLSSDLPSRRSVSTYLDHLDKLWRGGWSWQWPLIIAGPPSGGKTLFLYQLIASSLLSFPSPWKVLYCDLAGDFRPDRILKILSCRTQATNRQYQLGRLDKLTLRHKFDFPQFLKWNYTVPDLGLWVIDSLDTFVVLFPFPRLYSF